MATASSSNASAAVLVHSSIIFSVADHWTRFGVQSGQPQQVIGALLAKKSASNDSTLELVTSFELPLVVEGPVHHADEGYFNAKIELLKETLPDLEFRGFYTTGDHTDWDSQDERLNSQAAQFHPAPLLLKFNPSSPVVGGKVSIGVFASKAGTTAPLESLPWKVASDISERIGVSHASHVSNTGSGEGSGQNAMMKSLSTQFGAANIFKDHVAVCIAYVNAVREGKCEADPEILQGISKLNEELGLPKTKELAELEEQQAIGQKLTILLSSMAGVEGSMSSLLSKLQVLHGDRQMGMMRAQMGGFGMMGQFYM